jgi:hypothetical protein
MDSTTTRTAKAAWCLLNVLRSKRLGYTLNGLALALLIALLIRYRLGYIPKFFVVSLPIALTLLATSTALVIVQRTNKSIFDFLVATAATCLMTLGSLVLSGLIPPTAAQVYRSQLEARAEVFRHSLPDDLQLFLNGFDKTNLNSFSDLARSASSYHERWRGNLHKQGFSEGEANAISLMLFTSTLWAFGNANHPIVKVGCIPTNEDNNWQYEKPTLQVVKQARIGCCTDYAFTLSLILSKNGFENRYVQISGHKFNEVKINGQWNVLDANTNVFINSSWNDAIAARRKVRIHVFPHPGQLGGSLHRPIISAFQNYLVNIVLFGESMPGTVMKGREPDREYQEAVDSLY